MKYHPDRNPGDDEAIVKFKEAAEAFEVLGHPKNGPATIATAMPASRAAVHPFPRRLRHLQRLRRYLRRGIFQRFLRGRRRRPRPRGADIRCEVQLDLLEAARGTSKIVRFMRHVACETCGGSGAKPGTRPEACRYCGGKGRVIQSSGIFSLQTTCPSCHGSGQVIREACGTCRGSGYVQKKITRKVDIPAGVDDRTRLRLRGEGEPSPQGGPPGDCYCFIHVTEHPLFQRRGQDLICQVPINYPQAALGATIEVPTLDGQI